ncbi:hypothetical protein V5D56_03685 [Cellulosimicrobium sp. PMB13]|uniref:hypothetical protein n=1 Tax=Cellulosimicrobium sp. PMB13 TaxID=3120158 RepID=UPI003F4C09D3
MTVHRAPAPTWISALIVGAVAVTALLITGEPSQAVVVTSPVLVALGSPKGRKPDRHDPS